MTHDTCATSGCVKPPKAAGKCGACYARDYRARRPEVPQPERKCAGCGTDMSGRRKDAQLCSKDCRNAARYAGERKAVGQCTVSEDGRRCLNEATHRITTDRWCRMRHARWERHGSPHPTLTVSRAKGSTQAQLQAAARATSDTCILVPSPTQGRLTASEDDM